MTSPDMISNRLNKQEAQGRMQYVMISWPGQWCDPSRAGGGREKDCWRSQQPSSPPSFPNLAGITCSQQPPPPSFPAVGGALERQGRGCHTFLVGHRPSPQLWSCMKAKIEPPCTDMHMPQNYWEATNMRTKCWSTMIGPIQEARSYSLFCYMRHCCKIKPFSLLTELK